MSYTAWLEAVGLLMIMIHCSFFFLKFSLFCNLTSVISLKMKRILFGREENDFSINRHAALSLFQYLNDIE